MTACLQQASRHSPTASGRCGEFSDAIKRNLSFYSSPGLRVEELKPFCTLGMTARSAPRHRRARAGGARSARKPIPFSRALLSLLPGLPHQSASGALGDGAPPRARQPFLTGSLSSVKRRKGTSASVPLIQNFEETCLLHGTRK